MAGAFVAITTPAILGITGCDSPTSPKNNVPETAIESTRLVGNNAYVRATGNDEDGPIGGFFYSLDNGIWQTEPGQEFYKIFKGLSTGDHNIRVKAFDNDNETDPSPEEWDFTVNPITEQGTITFVARINGNYDLFTMNPDGSDKQRITSTEGDEAHPSWNPDKTKIVYSSEVGEFYQLFKINPDGSHRVQLTHDEQNNWLPQYSPNGLEIVFTKENDLYLMDSNGTNERPLTDGRGAKWHPTQPKVVYTDGPFLGAKLFTINIDGNNREQLTFGNSDDVSPAYNKTGSQIIYTHRRNNSYDLFRMNQDGTQQVPISTGVQKIYAPMFSPDNAKIIFHSCQSTPWGIIYSIDATGGNLENLTSEYAGAKYADWK